MIQTYPLVRRFWALPSSLRFQRPAGHNTVTRLVAIGTNMVATFATAESILAGCLIGATGFQIVTPADRAIYSALAELQVEVFEFLWATFLCPGQLPFFVDPWPWLLLCSRLNLWRPCSCCI